MTTVLIVDDNAVDRKVAGACVTQTGWKAQFAANGAEALESLEQHKPDLVLTDLQMPEVDGLELVRQMNDRYADVPAVLITAHGSEELAVAALQAGASSYLPKRNLCRELRNTLQVVLDAAESGRRRQRLFQYMTGTQSSFAFGHNSDGPRTLVSYCQDALQMLGLCSDALSLQVGTALHEALRNAVDHGNLELSSTLRETDDGAYEALREQRRTETPYSNRCVHVETFVTRDEAKYVIRDEGPGFDPSALPDPTDPENLLRASGRGVLLMRAFMDDVIYNDRGNEVTMVKRRGE